MNVFGKWIIAITIGIGSFTIPSGEARAEEPEIELELPDIDPARIPKPKMPRILKGQLMTSAGTSSLGGVGFFELVAGGDTRSYWPRVSGISLRMMLRSRLLRG